MDSLVSIRLNEHMLQELNTKAHLLQVTKTQYIRMAIKRMNQDVENNIKKKKLTAASLKVRKESMKINAEFGDIEHDPED